MPQHDLLLVMGDFNAKIGRDNQSFEHVIGKEGLEEGNENGRPSLVPRPLSYFQENWCAKEVGLRARDQSFALRARKRLSRRPWKTY